jgi:hypothetical protein
VDRIPNREERRKPLQKSFSIRRPPSPTPRLEDPPAPPTAILPPLVEAPVLPSPMPISAKASWKVVTAELSLIFGLVLGYRATTGITDMVIARSILGAAWVVGVIFICQTSPRWGSRFSTIYRFLAGTTMACCLGLTFTAYDYYIVSHFVIVKPDVPFALSESRSVETSLYVNNRADEPAYSVLMQVKILTARVSSDTLRMDIADDKITAHANPFNNETAIADVRFCLGTDVHGAESAFVLFPTIPPHVTYVVTVAGVPPKTMAIAHIMTSSLMPHGYASRSALQDCAQLLPPSEKITVRWTFFKIVGKKQPPTQQ